MSRFNVEDAAIAELPKNVKKLYGFLTQAGLTAEDISAMANFDRLEYGTYQTTIKREDGTPETVTNRRAGIVVSPKFESGPEWELVRPAPVVKRAGKKPKRVTGADGVLRILVLPDAQIGHWYDADGNLQPTHDPAAMGVAVQIARLEQPDIIVMLGDMIDLPECSSKYVTEPAFAGTTQASIDTLGEWCGEVRLACPAADIHYMEGNHDLRMVKLVYENARAAFGLRKQGAPPESWPLISIPSLCNFDQYGIMYHSGYPASSLYLEEAGLRFLHGTFTSKNTPAAYLDRHAESVVYGHIHRFEMLSKQLPNGRTIHALSPGCLCRTDGVVPGTHSGTDIRTLEPVTTNNTWTQGVAVIRVHDGVVYPEMIPIIDGVAHYRDRIITAGETDS